MARFPNEIGCDLYLPVRGGDVRIDATLADIRLVCAHPWRVDSDGYAACNIEGKRVLLHRMMLGLSDPTILGDHRNLIRLDNRRENLRIATKAENGQNRTKRADNTSGYKGVYLCRTTGQWRAELSANRVRHRLGRFPSPEAAARAYDKAAIKYHGDFARINFKKGSK